MLSNIYVMDQSKNTTDFFLFYLTKKIRKFLYGFDVSNRTIQDFNWELLSANVLNLTFKY